MGSLVRLPVLRAHAAPIPLHVPMQDLQWRLARNGVEAALPGRRRARGAWELTPARASRPAHFAWIDHRLRERLRELSLEEMALLLFLHLAANRTGCSFWADATIAKKLGLREGDVIQARSRLVAKGLVAYRSPLSQLLPLEEPRP